jgi:hypothetical protein
MDEALDLVVVIVKRGASVAVNVWIERGSSVRQFQRLSRNPSSIGRIGHAAVSSAAAGKGVAVTDRATTRRGLSNLVGNASLPFGRTVFGTSRYRTDVMSRPAKGAIAIVPWLISNLQWS